MSATGKAFRYSLESLLKKRNWDLDVQRGEENRARHVVENIEQEKKKLEDYIESLMQEIRKSRCENTVLQPDKYHAMVIYINDQRRFLKETSEQLEKTKNLHQQIVEQIKTIRKSIKSLEKHKEKKQKYHSYEEHKSLLAQSDELWLIHKHRPQS